MDLFYNYIKIIACCLISFCVIILLDPNDECNLPPPPSLISRWKKMYIRHCILQKLSETCIDLYYPNHCYQLFLFNSFVIKNIVLACLHVFEVDFCKCSFISKGLNRWQNLKRELEDRYKEQAQETREIEWKKRKKRRSNRTRSVRIIMRKVKKMQR